DADSLQQPDVPAQAITWPPLAPGTPWDKEASRDDGSPDRHTGRVAGRPRKAARTREAAHPAGGRAGPPAPRAALGPGRQALSVRHRPGPADPGRAVRRPLPAARLPLHVRPQLPG